MYFRSELFPSFGLQFLLWLSVSIDYSHRLPIRLGELETNRQETPASALDGLSCIDYDEILWREPSRKLELLSSCLIGQFQFQMKPVLRVLGVAHHFEKQICARIFPARHDLMR